MKEQYRLEMNWKLATDILDILSLLVQFLGAIIMYLNSPINRITGNTHGGNYDQSIPKKKNQNLKNGFLLLSVGIILSIVSLLLKDFLT